MRVLVTGSSGYIGSILVPLLLEKGHKVIGFDSLRHALPAISHNPSFTFVHGDVRNPFGHILPKADAVIHLAALVGAPICDRFPDEATAVNDLAVRELVSRLSPSQMLIYPNSQSGYGKTPGIPIDESASMQPLSLYAFSKCNGERHALAHPRSKVMRLATLYGVSPRMRTDLLVNDFVLRAYRDRKLTLYEGHHCRAICHVRDAAYALSMCLTEEIPFQSVHNVVSDNVSKRSLAECIQTFYPEFIFDEDEFKKDPDQRDYAVSADALKGRGWKPQHSLTNGIPELLKFYSTVPITYVSGNI
jgi:nucleoside-diphosphate-sugar epimerase